MVDVLALLELVVPFALAPMLFVGYRRVRRLQHHVPDERLTALGTFFLLYGIATLLRFGIALAVIASGEFRGASPAAVDPLVFTPDDPAFVTHFLVVHALIVWAFAVVAWQYVRRIAARHVFGMGLVVAIGLPALEALLALVPAVSTLVNQRGRHTRRSRHIAWGFALLAVGHMGLLPLAVEQTTSVTFHFVIVSQTLALIGALTLVFSLPRGME